MSAFNFTDFLMTDEMEPADWLSSMTGLRIAPYLSTDDNGLLPSVWPSDFNKAVKVYVASLGDPLEEQVEKIAVALKVPPLTAEVFAWRSRALHAFLRDCLWARELLESRQHELSVVFSEALVTEEDGRRSIFDWRPILGSVESRVTDEEVDADGPRAPFGWQRKGFREVPASTPFRVRLALEVFTEAMLDFSLRVTAGLDDRELLPFRELEAVVIRRLREDYLLELPDAQAAAARAFGLSATVRDAPHLAIGQELGADLLKPDVLERAASARLVNKKWARFEVSDLLAEE